MKKKRSKFIIYEYANNLYGWKMSENLLFLRYFGSHKMNMIVFMWIHIEKIIQKVLYYKLILTIQETCTMCIIIIYSALKRLRSKKLCYQMIVKKLQISRMFPFEESKSLCQGWVIKINIFFTIKTLNYIYS